MKISDLLGEGWESDERTDARVEPREPGTTSAAPDVSYPPPVSSPAEPVETPRSDVIPSLATWSPAPSPRDAEPPAPPASARAQLADLAAGLAAPNVAPIEPEAEAVDAPDELAGLAVVVDDLLPGATKRGKGSTRGSSRSGSRRRGR